MKLTKLSLALIRIAITAVTMLFAIGFVNLYALTVDCSRGNIDTAIITAMLIVGITVVLLEGFIRERKKRNV